MRFGFTEDQLLLQSTLRDFLAKECPPAVIRAIWASETGHDAGLWTKLAELGVPGLLVPEANGGLGRDELDLVLLLEEAGRAALCGPIVSTTAIGAPLLAELDTAELRDPWLARAASGHARIAVGLPGARFVADAAGADLLLLASGDEIHAVAPDAATLTREPANDPGRRLFTVRFPPSVATRVASGEAARRALAAAFDRAALAAAAQAIGVADRLVEMACAYARERRQFDTPIGSFQAVKHKFADLVVALEKARASAYFAALTIAEDDERRAIAASAAKVAAADCERMMSKEGIQLHGGIGYTWEHDMHLLVRRAKSSTLLFGSPGEHRARIASLLGV